MKHLSKSFGVNMSQNLFIDPQSAVVHLPQCSCLFVQVLKREDQDLWNNFKICGIFQDQLSVCLGTGKRGSGSVEQLQDLRNYSRISCLFGHVYLVPSKLEREDHDSRSVEQFQDLSRNKFLISTPHCCAG